jgi:hypothetical protein
VKKTEKEKTSVERRGRGTERRKKNRECGKWI